MKKYKVNTLSEGEFNSYVERVRKQCPRTNKVFCDGEPNPIPKGEHVNYGVCQHFKNGKCTYFDREQKEERRAK